MPMFGTYNTSLNGPTSAYFNSMQGTKIAKSQTLIDEMNARYINRYKDTPPAPRGHQERRVSIGQHR